MSLTEKLLNIIPEKEQVVRHLITLVGNDKKNLIQVSQVIEHIALREQSMWAYKALDLIENNND